MYNALGLMGNANAAGVNHHDLQVGQVEHGNYLAKSSFFFGKKKTHVNKLWPNLEESTPVLPPSGLACGGAVGYPLFGLCSCVDPR